MNFPSSPTLNQEYSFGTKSWRWNGTAWQIISVSTTEAVAAAAAATAAASSASAASTSASNAASSATAAASSATSAAASASEAVTTLASTVKLIGDQTIAGTKTLSSNPVLSGGTANGVAYLNGSKVLTSGSALQFDGSNLGLGVTPSAWGASYKPLQLGSSAFSGAVAAFVGNAQTFVTSNAYHNGTSWIYTNNSGAGYYQIAGVSNGAHAWYTAPSGTAGNAISFTQAMTLDASGNLGIGTSSPSTKLHLQGSSATYIQITDVGDGASRVGQNGSALTFGVDLADGSTERMRIDSSGNLLVGTTSGSYKVDVSGDVNVTGSYRVNGVATTGLTGGQTGSAPLYGARAWVNFNGTGTVAIRASGNVSSITDNGTGDYTVNFTTAMADANYAVFGLSNWDGTNRGSLVGLNNLRTKATTSVPITTQQSAAYTLMDCSEVAVSIFR